MSSTRESMVMISLLGLVTTTVKVKSPPDRKSLGEGDDLATAITGTGVRVTVALSLAVTEVPSGLWPTTVTVSVWESPELPVKGPVKLHGADEAPGARVVPMSRPHVEPGRVGRSP